MSAYNVFLSMIEEVSLTPKPGLVDMHHNGAHKDMNWQLLFDSAKAIYPVMLEIEKTRFTGDIKIDWKLLKKIGLEAEERMFEITKGVNTHRGQIFLLGLSLYVLKFVYTYNQYVERMKEAIVEYENMFPQVHTKGFNVRKKGKYGILDEIKNGFPSLSIANKMYKENINKYNHVASLTIALLAIMSILQDTTTIHRGGEEALLILQKKSFSLVFAEDKFSNRWWGEFDSLDKWMIENNISAGGSADILALFIFLNKEKIFD